MSELRISIVIPSHNVVEFIEETIRSILNQDYPNFECIVMDGGSNDGTLDVLKRYEGRITWISEEDRGQSDAINKGIKLANGDIVTYICADDVYEEGCFRKVADFLGENPDVKWVYGRCKIADNNGVEVRKLITWYKNFWQRRYSYNKLLIMDFIAQPAVFWRRELVDEIGFFDIDEHLAMDYEYWLRVGAKYNPGFIDDYLARFRVHPCSKSSVSFSQQSREALSIAQRYSSSSKRYFLAPLQCLNCFSIIFSYSILNFAALIRAKWRKLAL